jgi:hypothetical protein
MRDAVRVKRAPVSALILVLGACNHRQRKMTDAQLKLARSQFPGITDACLDKMRWGGVEAMPNEVDKCFKMLPQQRWRGLWRNDFEASKFCPAPARECTTRVPGPSIWLDFRSGLNRPAGLGLKGPSGGLYAIDFIGRRTAYPGIYAGGADQEMIIDRLISIKEVEPPPPEPTAAQMAAQEKACEAAGQCISLEELQSRSRAKRKSGHR